VSQASREPSKVRAGPRTSPRAFLEAARPRIVDFAAGSGTGSGRWEMLRWRRTWPWRGLLLLLLLLLLLSQSLLLQSLLELLLLLILMLLLSRSAMCLLISWSPAGGKAAATSHDR